MELLRDGLLPIVVECLLYRAVIKESENGVLFGELSVFKPHSVWAFDWNSEIGKMHLVLIESEPLHPIPANAESNV